MAAIEDDLLDGIFDQMSDVENWAKIVEFIADEFQQVIDAILYLDVLTWVDVAEGVWLDRVGAIVGVRRPPNEELTRVFRCRGASDPWYDPNHGFASPTNPSIGGYLSGIWGVPADGVASDTLYRDYIYAKIAATNADASIPGIAIYVLNAFGLATTVSASGRDISVEITGTFNLQQRRFIEYFAPNVAGTNLSVINWPEL